MSQIQADNGLVMGNIVSPRRMEILQQISRAQAPLDACQVSINSLMVSKRQFGMIHNEMINMGVDKEDLRRIQEEEDKLKNELAEQAVQLGRQMIDAQIRIRSLKSDLSDLTFTPSSPVDFTKSTFIRLPLSADSLSLDVQYFRNESVNDKAGSHAATVASHVGNSFTGYRSPKTANDMSNAARNFVLNQTQNHDIAGTIVISASCTHRIAQVLDPFILDPKKAVASWNAMYPLDKLRTNPKSVFHAALVSAEDQDDESADNILHILSGATFGSSFVGMIHMLRSNNMSTGQSAESTAAAMKKMMTSHLSVSEQSGDFGITSDFAEMMKALMSQSSYSSHCNIVTEGIIPSITSSTMKTSVASLKPNPKEIMSQLSAIQGANDGVVNDSLEAMAGKSKTGAQFMKLNSNYLKDTVSALGTYDHDQNKVIDMNSLMIAFEDYVSKAIDGKSGTPLNYFIRELHKRDIATAYIATYYPNGAQKFRGRIGLGEATKGEEDGDSTSS